MKNITANLVPVGTIQMNDKNELWFFYHRVKKTKLGPFPLEALCTFLINEKIELDHVLLCQSGWPKWKKGIDLSPFLNQYQKCLREKDDVLPSTEDYEDIEELPPTIPLAINPIKQNDHEKRKHPRVAIELKVVFIVEKKSFRTRTFDLSLGGLKIVDPLPEFYFNRQIQVFLSSPDLKISIKFEAELLANTSSLTHLQFSSKNDIGLKHLEAWLMSISDSQARKKLAQI